MRNNSPHCYHKRAKGSIALLTLWSVLFLALFSLALNREVSGLLSVASGLKWETKIRAMATKALAEVVTLLGEDKIWEYDSLLDPWFDNRPLFKEVPFAGGTLSVVSDERGEEGRSRFGLADEEQKISLNHAPLAVLSSLFQIAGGLSQSVADDVALLIVDWRDENTTKEGTSQPEDCTYLAIPSRCKNSDFEVLEELFLIQGMNPHLFRQVKDHLTTYGAGPCNINTATEISLMAHGLSEAGAAKIATWRKAGNVFQNVSWITGRSHEFGLDPRDQSALEEAASSGLFGIRSDFYRALVRAEFGGTVRGHVSFIVDRQGVIQSWRE